MKTILLNALYLILPFLAIAQNPAIGIKSYNLSPHRFSVMEALSSYPRYDSKSLTSESVLFYESPISSKSYVIGALTYIQQKVEVSRLWNLNNGATFTDTSRRNNQSLRFEAGVGKRLLSQDRFSFRLNATGFYQFTFEQRNTRKYTTLDSNSTFLGSVIEEVKEPGWNEMGISFTPQITYRVWEKLYLLFDIRFDFTHFIYNGIEQTRYEERDRNNNLITSSVSNESVRRSYQLLLEHYGIGVYYVF